MASINPTGVTLETKEEKIIEPITVKKVVEMHIKISPLAKRIADDNDKNNSEVTH